MTECIHGLDIELCDICAPRKAPDPQDQPVRKSTPPTRRTQAREPIAPRTLRTPPVAPKRTATAPALPDIDLTKMRVHHWTHLSNLPAILEAGELRAGAVPELDVASSEAREAREAAAVPTGTTVAGHVPFALTPDAATWDEVRSGAEGVKWSTAARATRPIDFVILVAPMSALGDDFVLADGDPTAALTRFASGAAESGTLARRASMADPDLLAVEILVPESFPMSSVTLIGVPNDRARDEVKAFLKAASGHAPRVAVYPPWFRASEV